MNRREFLRHGGSLCAAATFVPMFSARLSAVVLSPEAERHVWQGPQMGTAPYVERKELLRRGASEARVRKAIDELSDEALRHVWRKPPEAQEELREKIARDRQQFHDEVPRFWQQADLLYERGPPPKYCQVEELKQGESFLLQLFRGGKRLRNVVTDLRGLSSDLSNRQFVLVGAAMRQTIPGVCGNCSLQMIVENQVDAICVPIPTGPNVRSVAEGLRRA